MYTHIIKIYILSFFLLAGTGCSTFNFARKKVEFVDPLKTFLFKTVKPDQTEKKGVQLRFIFQDKPLVYSDFFQIYTQITGGNAISIDFNKIRKLSFSKTKQKDTFYLLTEISTEKKAEGGSEKVLTNSRGEILKFVKGNFKGEKGEIEFLSHKKSAVFPEKSVTIGDRWFYDESMEIDFDSMLLSRKSEEPDTIKVNCRLEGFALVDGHRCAVISASTVSNRKEKYSTFFSEMSVSVNIYINERIFFDYKKGIIRGVITKTESFSTSEKDNFSDHSRSQSISILKTQI